MRPIICMYPVLTNHFPPECYRNHRLDLGFTRSDSYLKDLFTGDGHLLQQHRAGNDIATHLDIGTDLYQLMEHVP